MFSSTAERPNVIVVFTDQQRWDSTGVHGNPLGLTPTFDEMARSGTHAAQAFTPQPVCGPARAAIQTGQCPTTTGCFRNGIPLPENCRTLADHFGAAGYATGYIGKWHLADTEPVPPEQRGGYTSWLGANILEFTSDAYRTVVFDDDDDPVMLPGYRSDALFDAAIRFVADHANPPGGAESVRQPFYLFCSLIEPHHQNEVDSYPAPIGYEERYQGRWLPPDLAALAAEDSTVHRHIGGYFGQVRRVDEGLGRLLDALRSLDLLENTIVAFTSDHGCHFKTRNSEYKRSCHDGSVRVPMALCGPGFDGGGRIDRPVSTIDLPPTLLDAAGLDVPPEMQGRSMLPLLHQPGAGDADGWPEEVFIQVSESEVGRAIRTSRWKYYVSAPDADAWHEAGADRYLEAELYDLAHDPYELDNLVGLPSHRKIADELRERLLRRMVEAGEQEPVIERREEAIADSQRSVDPGVHASSFKPVRFGHQPRSR
ncbi:sulfatase-like hydrolase/transferase [Phytoactinopolyspora endophytica]|uniref:sulfatase-like hydrolase/transferase n=1 Tax=Phytoactinopolyspora endophytica TaxID=1642495 RepID=UPI00101E041A|nr:sulfatase-like hydrolase/transferase [Phytoactinopolyspora endophytica]